MSSKLLISVILSSFIAAAYLKRRNSKTRKSIADSKVATAFIKELKAPISPSWLAGHLPLFIKPYNAGEADDELIKTFGPTCKVKLTFSIESLFTADPKALQYVLNTSGYNFHKREAAKLSRVLMGKNILGVEGEEHARQRRMLLPSFSSAHLRELVPAFAQTTAKLAERWRDLIESQQGAEGMDIDVYWWLSRLTMDAIGQGVLSYDFGALTDEPSKYVEAYRGLFDDMFNEPTNFQLVMAAVLTRLPESIARSLLGTSIQGMNRFEHFMSVSDEVAASIIAREKEAILMGKAESKDLLSILIRANVSEDPQYRLTDKELLSQLHAFTIAGHDTTAAMLRWVFYEVALHPEAQAKMREEIRVIKEAKGIQELGALDLESLHYTNAVLKETLRFHPIAPYNGRNADRDDIIPLAYPLKTASGKEIQAIHIKKGQSVFMSFYGYNRIKDLWGEDPDKWIPERFLNEGESERSKRTMGVFAHLATFSSGVHGCIGWRFAVLEMLTILTGLVERFEFSLGSSNPIILRKLGSSLYPVVKGEEKRGPQLPLFIKPIS